MNYYYNNTALSAYIVYGCMLASLKQ